MLRGYRRDDPKSAPQLAVPVSITEHLLHQHWANPQHYPHREATADLNNIAFYYLLAIILLVVVLIELVVLNLEIQYCESPMLEVLPK
jgi:hypothetical protein